MLRVEGLQAGYDDTQVLFGIDLEVRESELVAVVGSNGVGKTTMLCSLAGLIAPRQGRILVDGRDIAGTPVHEVVAAGLVYVPEGRRLFPRMSVRKNLELGAYSRHARASLKQQLDFVFHLFPVLRERSAQLAGTLSGGEQQMCAIGRGLMSMPRLLMLDEVSLGLAPVIVKRVYETIREIRGHGTTILIVEQNVRLALQVSDRAYVVQGGRIVLSGDSKQLMGSPEVRRAYLGL